MLQKHIALKVKAVLFPAGVIATNKDSIGRFCADFVASLSFLSLFSKYDIAWLNATPDLVFFCQDLLRTPYMSVY